MKNFNFLTIALFILFSCKKQDSNNQSELKDFDSQPVQSVINWLNTDPSKSPARIERLTDIKSNLDFSRLSIEKLTDDETLILIPLKKEFSSNLNKDKMPDNYLLIYKNRDGHINNGNLIQYVPIFAPERPLTASTVGKILSGQEITLSGSLSFLSLFDRFFSEIKFENGVKKSLSTLSSTKRSSQVSNRPPLMFCIEWYLETTTFNSNGTTSTTEDYLYTSCYAKCHPNEICDSKVSDGFGGGTVCEDLAPEVAGRPVSIMQAVSTIAANQTTRTKAYRWKIYEQNMGLWSFSSHETGTHKNVRGVWQWQSLVHQSISKSGIWAGGTVNCTLNTAIPQVGIFYAGMQLNYTITFNILFTGCPLAGNRTCVSNSPIWNVND